ncbi:MAG: sigma-70 family RNA polymerase sigma factor, partial [Planctomycetes bacterium]|nr:sigma-70 family RNA polymerase sigma factor [Planctomycetota bacterium]
MIRRAIGGDEQARDEFARIHYALVHAFLRRRWQGTTAMNGLDDAVQDVFLDCLRPDGALSRVDFARLHSIRAFLLGITVRVARRHERRRASRRQHQRPMADPNAVVESRPSVAQQLDRVWARALVQRALARLDHLAEVDPRRQRRVALLRLRYIEDIPLRELAEVWSVDPAWLHHEHSTARRELSGALRTVLAGVLRVRHEDLELECARLLEFF